MDPGRDDEMVPRGRLLFRILAAKSSPVYERQRLPTFRLNATSLRRIASPFLPTRWASRKHSLYTIPVFGSWINVGAQATMNASISTTFLRRVSTRPAQWTCTSCRSPVLRTTPNRNPVPRQNGWDRRTYSSKTTGQPRRPRGRVLLFASVAGAGASILAVTDNVKSTYQGSERALRVASALFICINE